MRCTSSLLLPRKRIRTPVIDSIYVCLIALLVAMGVHLSRYAARASVGFSLLFRSAHPSYRVSQARRWSGMLKVFQPRCRLSPRCSGCRNLWYLPQTSRHFFSEHKLLTYLLPRRRARRGFLSFPSRLSPLPSTQKAPSAVSQNAYCRWLLQLLGGTRSRFSCGC